MANTLISGLTELTTAPAAGDWIEIETSAGVSKKVKLSTLFAYRSNVGRFGMGFSVPSTALALDGSTVSRATYADLWTYVNANYSPITLAAWNAGAVGNFSVGNGSTTFGLPDFSGLFPRFSGDNSVMKMADGSTSFNGGNVFSVLGDVLFKHWHVLMSGASNTSLTNAGSGTPYLACPTSPSANPGDLFTATTVDNFCTNGVKDPSSNGTDGTPTTGKETSPARVSLIPYVYFAD